jgi:hypothetical protein
VQTTPPTQTTTTAYSPLPVTTAVEFAIVGAEVSACRSSQRSTYGEVDGEGEGEGDDEDVVSWWSERDDERGPKADDMEPP